MSNEERPEQPQYPPAPDYSAQPTVQFPPANQQLPQQAPQPSYQAPQPGVQAQPGYPAPQGYQQQPGYPAQPGYQPSQPQAPFNTLAIVAFVGSFFVSLVGIICGHIALGQIKRDGSRGRGLALAGTIIGYVAFVFTIIGLVLSFVFVSMAANVVNTAATEFGDMAEQSEDFGLVPEGESIAGSEFCELLNSSSDTSALDPNDPESAKLYAQQFRDLAAAAPPESAEVYDRFADFLEDPAATSADPNISDGLMEEFFSTLMSDAMRCI